MSKDPAIVLDSIFAFPPNRETLGGSAYLIVGNQGNILVDCPAWHQQTQRFVASQGGVSWLVLTHRQNISRHILQMQQWWNCQVIIQEQEAYLLPQVKVTPFRKAINVTESCRAFWTPGHSPGSACLYYRESGGILFTGRHLIPNQQGNPVPLRTAKTFHWPRQLQSVKTVLAQFTPETLHFICPGANIGYLRGDRRIKGAYELLTLLDFSILNRVAG